jgi:hypothetical protein
MAEHVRGVWFVMKLGSLFHKHMHWKVPSKLSESFALLNNSKLTLK